MKTIQQFFQCPFKNRHYSDFNPLPHLAIKWPTWLHYNWSLLSSGCCSSQRLRAPLNITEHYSNVKCISTESIWQILTNTAVS